MITKNLFNNSLKAFKQHTRRRESRPFEHVILVYFWGNIQQPYRSQAVLRAQYVHNRSFMLEMFRNAFAAHTIQSSPDSDPEFTRTRITSSSRKQ
jgi:hypothetical protein